MKITVILLLIVAVLYGTSYQQFRHFRLHEPRGMHDTASYAHMAQGNKDVRAAFRARIIVPTLAGGLSEILKDAMENKEEALCLSFYLVNFLFMSLTALLFFLVLEKLHFSTEWSILGVLLFLTSRVTAYTTALPFVDSIYYLALLTIVYLSLSSRVILLSILYPLLILTKETILPFLFIPLFRKTLPKLPLVVALLGSGALFVGTRIFVDSSGDSIVTEVMLKLSGVATNFGALFSLRGLHNFSHGFSFILVFAVCGWIVSRREKRQIVPGYLLLILPISLVYALLNPNSGRMLFSAFVVIIPYALAFLQNVLSHQDNHEQPS